MFEILELTVTRQPVIPRDNGDSIPPYKVVIEYVRDGDKASQVLYLAWSGEGGLIVPLLARHILEKMFSLQERETLLSAVTERIKEIESKLG